MSSNTPSLTTQEEELLLDSEYMKSRMLLNKLFGEKAAALLDTQPGSSSPSSISPTTPVSRPQYSMPSAPSPTISRSQNYSNTYAEPAEWDPIDKRKCREVPYPSFQYAANANGEEKQRLFVFEPNSQTLIREYAKYIRDRWYCLGCRLQPHRKSNQGRMEGHRFYAPIEHVCSPVSYAEAIVKQQKIKLKLSENLSGPRFVSSFPGSTSYRNAAQKVTGEIKKPDTPKLSMPTPFPNASLPMTVGFREVSPDDYFYGYNADGTQNMRLIIYEADNRNALREYGFTTSKWYCLGCSRITKTRNFAGFENDVLKAPIAHLCKPYTKKEVDDRQSLFEKRKGAQKRGPKGPTKSPAAKRAAVFGNGFDCSGDITPQLRSLVESIDNGQFHGSSSSSPQLLRNDDDQEFEEEQKPASIGTPENPPIVINLPTFDFESLRNPVTFSFNNPSKVWLKKACETLQIPYNHEAYQLWATIDIDEIQSSSSPDKIMEVSAGENSGFRAISLLLTGKEDAKIKESTNKWFYKNFNKLGRCLGINFSNFTHHEAIVYETFFASEMTEVHCEALCRILECRIGVYDEDGKLRQYGNWSSDDANVTLLLELKEKGYNVVTSLKNN